MTTSTNVERGRLRARRALLALSTILCSGLAAPALAQSAPPPYVDVDKNGVDLVSGNFVTSLTEATIGSGEGAVALTRTRSGAQNWVDNWTGGLIIKTVGSTTTASVILGAIGDNFSLSGSTFTSLKGDGATLVANTISSSPGYLYTAADGTKIQFRSTGPGAMFNHPLVGFACALYSSTTCSIPDSITKPNGMKFTLNWTYVTKCTSGSGPTCVDPKTYYRFSGVTSSAGYGFTLSYVTDLAGNFSVPQTNWYLKTAATFGNSNNPPASAPVVSYPTPSSDHPNFNDPAGRQWIFGGGQQTLLTSIQRPGASSASTSISYSGTPSYVSSITVDGVTTNYSRVVSGSTATTTITDALSNQTIAVADLATGRVTKVTQVLSTGNRITTFAYDTNGRLTEITYPLSNKVQYLYDSRGNVTTTTSKAKPSVGGTDIVTAAAYDATCTNVVKCNSPNATTDANLNQTVYAYDPTTGQVTSVTAPTTAVGQPQARYSYTTIGGVSMLSGMSQCQAGSAPSCVGTSDEVKTSVSYNTNLLPTSVSKGAGDGSVTATTAFTYDPIGNVSTADGPLAGTADTTTYRYDADRERVGLVSPDPDGAGLLKRRANKTSFNSDGQRTVVEAGTVNGTTDTDWAAFATLQQSAASYDANARKSKEVTTAGGTTYGVTQYSYDSLGRIDCVATRMNSAAWASLPTSACTAGTAGGDGPDRIFKNTYDAVGAVTKLQTAYGVTGVQADEATATYTDNGLTETLTDAEGNKTSYAYDGFDRQLKTSYPSTAKGAGTSSATDYEQLGYDANGNVTSRRLRDGVTLGYNYDALNRLVQRAVPTNSNPDDTTVTYSYDLLGRPLLAAKNSTNQTTLTWDALGRKLSEANYYYSLAFQYDAVGQRTRTTWQDGLYVAYDYDPTGNMTAVRENGASSGIGVLATYGYDDLGRRTVLTRGNGVVTSYGYDAVSRLTSLTSDLTGSSYDSTTTLSYNPASQIVSATRSNDAYAWSGSATGSKSYTTNGLNQFTASDSTSLSYDARGNLNSSGANSYTYTSENRLTYAGSATFYTDSLDRMDYIGPEGLLVGHDGSDAVIEKDLGSGAIARRYVFGAGNDEPLVWYEGSGTSDRRWMVPDERGSTVAVTNASGSATAINTYDEYGNPGSGNIGRLQYTGQAWIPSLSLYYYKARMYSPMLGRFLQTDPVGYGDGLNWYNYVKSDPVNRRDPTGQYSCEDDFGRVTLIPGQQSTASNGDIVNVGAVCGGPVGLNPRRPANGGHFVGGGGGRGNAHPPETGPGNSQPTPSLPCRRASGWFPRSGGAAAGASGAIGLANAGAYADFSDAIGIFPENGFASALSGGAGVVGGNASATTPSSQVSPTINGAYAGLGLGAFVSNAENVGQLSGDFTSYVINAWVVSINFSYSQGTYVISATGGPGGGLAASAYNTNTFSVDGRNVCQ